MNSAALWFMSFFYLSNYLNNLALNKIPHNEKDVISLLDVLR